MTSSFPEPFPHDSIQTLFPHVFTVRGSIKMGIWGHISRNMTIIREGDSLCLINAVRLSKDEEKKLEELGEIKHILRIGFYHGIDDPYYVDRYNAKLWTLPEHSYPNNLSADYILAEDHPLPFSNSRILTFRHPRVKEAVLLLENHDGILITCDSIQNIDDLALCSPQMKLLLKVFGFVKPANIGPAFRRFAETKGGDSLEPDLRRILHLPFRHLLSAHGSPLLNEAHSALEKTLARTYEKK